MTNPIDRRHLFKAAGAAGLTATLPVSSALAQPPAHDHNHDAPAQQAQAGGSQQLDPHVRAFVFLTSAEAAFVRAAIAIFIPADDLGPGAIEAGVDYYIDRQLAGAFGQGERMYLAGPFGEGLPQQGYQLPLTPADIYRIGIRAVNDYCQKNFQGATFDGLSAEQRAAVLSDLDQAKITLTELPGPVFVNLMLANTLEGFFGDPAYGGNRDMIGWKLVGFPGAYGMYADKIEEYRNKPFTEAMVSLADLQG